jgi:hypothetical protein
VGSLHDHHLQQRCGTDDNPTGRVFAVANGDESAKLAETLGAAVVSSADTEWTNTALIKDPQGAPLVLSQFIPPPG